MRIVREIKNKLTGIVNKFRYKKIQRDLQISNTRITFDIGASSIKCSDGKNYVSFISSVRKAIDTEISIQSNKVLVNNQWYIIGESTIPTGNYTYKYEKPLLDVLIIHGINELKKLNKNIGTDVKINLLLPYNQLSTIDNLKSKLNGIYNVDGEEMNILVDRVVTEGEASKYFIDKSYGSNTSNVCINIGYSTTDCVLFDRNNNRQAISTINMGSNILLSNYLKHFPECPSSNVLCSWFDEGFKLTNSEKANVNIENEKYLELLWNDLYNSILRLCNKQNTTIYIMGGTSNLLGDMIEKVLVPKGFKIVLLKDEQAKYSDLIGAMLMTGNNVEVPQKEIKKKEVKKTTRRSKYPEFVKLIESGLDKDDIIEKLSIAEQTYKNYKVRWKRWSAA